VKAGEYQSLWSIDHYYKEEVTNLDYPEFQRESRKIDSIKMFRVHRQTGTSNFWDYYPEEGLIKDEEWGDTKLPEGTTPEKFFAGLIEACKEIAAEEAAKKRHFGRAVISMAKKSGLYSPDAAVSEMAQALRWKQAGLPKLSVKRAKKAQKHLAWNHIDNVVGEKYTALHLIGTASCETVQKALLLYSK
jgi:organic hydroperoxide reductase OsmC/OhrA